MRIALAPAVTATLLLLAALPAQDRPTGPAGNKPQRPSPIERKREMKALIRELADPATMPKAVDRLMAMGTPAMPWIVQALEDRDLRVTTKAMEIVHALGPAGAEAAGPRLTRIARGKDPKRATLAQWALRAFPRGDSMMAVEYNQNRVVRKGPGDAAAALIRSDVKSVWDAEPVPGGGLLVTQYSPGKVIEFDATGKEAWSFGDLKQPLEADRLISGNTLISDTYGKRVIEVDHEKNVVWQHDVKGSPYDAERLPNGHTLITSYEGQILEVAPDQSTIWKLDLKGGPFDADRLANGNTLVTLYQGGAVREVDRDGKTVFEITGLKQPNEADRLPNGHTIVALSGKVVEYDNTGTEVRTWGFTGRIAKIQSR